MAITTIFRVLWNTPFTPPYEAWQTYSPGGGGYWTGLPAEYVPELYNGECIEVVTPGTCSLTSFGLSPGDERNKYLFGGSQFYGCGTDDPNRVQIPDDGTYAWDQRGVIVEVSYRIDADAFHPDNDGAYMPLIVLAKGLFSSSMPFMVALYGNDNDEYSRTIEIKRELWPQSAGITDYITPSFETPIDAFVDDGQFHRFKLDAQPGTITVGAGLDVAGGYTVASDGYWKLYVDGVLWYSEVDIPLYFGFSNVAGYSGNPVLMRSVWLGYNGTPGPTRDLHLYRGIPTTTPPPGPLDPIPPSSEQHCCSTVVDPTQGETVAGDVQQDPFVPYQPWIRHCVAMGEVETVGSPSDSENWT